MKRILIPILILLISAALFGCGNQEETVTTTVTETVQTASYDFEVMDDNCMMGANYSEFTPVYVYGEILEDYSNKSEDGYAVNKKCTPEAFDFYKKDCIEAGYEERQTSIIEDNTFCMLSDGTHIITIMDTPALSKMFITVEAADLQDFDSVIALTKSADEKTSLSMIGQDAGKYAMGFVFRLKDGRFVVIDGGYKNNSSADWVFNEMQSQTPDGESIVIAAWILTHAHDDHCGTFVSFTAKYAKKVTLERLLYNFGFDEQYTSTGQNYTYDENVRILGSEKNYPGLKIINPHPGNVYNFGDFKITYIYTGELMIGSDMSSFNTTSTVFTVETEGQKYAFLGDTNSENAPLMMDIYPGDTLNCDVLQVAHHGYNGKAMNADFYAKISPEFVLWPSSTENFEKSAVQSHEANKWLFENVSADNIWVARDQLYRFSLPLASACDTLIEY